MAYWLDLFTPYTWNRFRDHGADTSGFRPRQRKAAFDRVKVGDIFVCYLVKLSRWCGVLEVRSDAFEDTTPIFAEQNDPFPIRFRVSPIVMLDFEFAIPVTEPFLWNTLSFTKSLAVGSRSWAQYARLRQSLVTIPESDGSVIVDALKDQTARARPYPLDEVDRRNIEDRTIVRTPEGEIAVEVPERDDEDTDKKEDIRESVRVQANVARLGIALGFSIWIPVADRQRIRDQLDAREQANLVTNLPLNYDSVTLRTIENIDVIWLDRRSIAHAFEIEHTTAVYSGLLRMADLLALQPRMQISLHIVAPTDRQARVRREIVRPVFSVLEGGAMYERCSFISYEAIDLLMAEPNLSHMRETILQDYEEYFEPS